MTDNILKHPDADAYRESYDFKEVIVTIERSDKRPLMAYETLAALDRVKFHILMGLDK